MSNRQIALERINAEVEKHTKKQYSSDDERFWYPQVDKAGNGNAVIRFLPAIDPKGDVENVPFVRYYLHSFQGPTGLWLVNEMCPTTKGNKCPICEYNRSLWNSGSELKKKESSRQKRQLKYISNVYIVMDPATPENEGQVRLFKYGQKIWKKLDAFMHPSFPGDVAGQPFDLGNDPDEPGCSGANFTLRIRSGAEGRRNYDESSFLPIGYLTEDKKLLARIQKELHPLQPFVDDSVFNDYKTIKEKLNRVLGLDGGSENENPFKEDTRSAPLQRTKAATIQIPDDEEMDEDYFRRLAAQE